MVPDQEKGQNILILNFIDTTLTFVQLPDAGRYDLNRALNVYLWRGQFLFLQKFIVDNL